MRTCWCIPLTLSYQWGKKLWRIEQSVLVTLMGFPVYMLFVFLCILCLYVRPMYIKVSMYLYLSDCIRNVGDVLNSQQYSINLIVVYPCVCHFWKPRWTDYVCMQMSSSSCTLAYTLQFRQFKNNFRDKHPDYSVWW